MAEQKRDIYTLSNGQEVSFPFDTPIEDVNRYIAKQWPATSDTEEALPSYGPGSEFPENPNFASRLWTAGSQAFQQGVRGISPGLRAAAATVGDDEQAWDLSQSQLAEIRKDLADVNPNPPSAREVAAKYKQEGLWSAVGEVFDLTAQAVGSSLGYMAPSLALIGGAWLTASSAPAIAVAGVGAGLTVRFAQYLSEQLERSYHDGEATVEEINLFKQMTFAAGQVALEAYVPAKASGALSAAWIQAAKKATPGGLIHRAATKAVAKTTKDYVESKVGIAAAKSFMTLTAIEGATETGQLVLERAAAGEPIMPEDEEAMHEYIENLVGATLGSFAFSGYAAHRTFTEPKRRKKQVAKEEAEKKKAIEEAQKQQQARHARTEEDVLKYTVASEKLEANLREEAETDNAAAQASALAVGKEEVEGIRGIERTLVDITQVLGDRNIDIASDPEAAAGFWRLVYRTVGRYDLKNPLPGDIDGVQLKKDIDEVYLIIAGLQGSDQLQSLPVTSSLEAVEIGERLEKKRKKRKPETKAEIKRQIEEAIEDEKSPRAGKRYIQARVNAIFDRMDEEGILVRVDDKNRTMYILDSAGIKLFGDGETRSMANDLLRMASVASRTGVTGRGIPFEVVGTFPNFAEAQAATGIIDRADYDEIRDALVTRGMLRKEKNRYVFNHVPNDIANRTVYSRSQVKVPKYVKRDADGNVERIETKKPKDMEGFVKETSYAIKGARYKDEEGGESRMLQSIPVDMVVDKAAADEAVKARQESNNEARREYLGTTADEAMPVADPEIAKLARSESPADQHKAAEALKKDPFREEAVIGRLGYDVKKGDQALENVDSSVVVTPDDQTTDSISTDPVENTIPHDRIGNLGKSVNVIVKYGKSTDDGHGFGRARMDVHHPEWRDWFNTVMAKIRDKGDKAFGKNGLRSWADRAGRTVIVDGVGDDAKIFVFDHMVDDDGNPVVHLYNAFEGKDNYGEEAEDYGPLNGWATLRGPDATAESIAQSENPEHSSSRKFSPAERIEHDISSGKGLAEIRAEPLTAEEPYNPRGIMSFLAPLLDKMGGSGDHSHFRLFALDSEDSAQRTSERIRIDGKKPEGDIDTMAMVRLQSRAAVYTWESLDVGYIEVHDTHDKAGNKVGETVVTTPLEFKNDAVGGIRAWVKDPSHPSGGTFEMQQYSSPGMFSAKRGNASGGAIAVLTAGRPELVPTMFTYGKAVRSLNMIEEAEANGQPRPGVPMTDEQIREAMDLDALDPEDAAIVAVMYYNLMEWTGKHADLLVQAHALEPSRRNSWARNMDYVSFYVDMEAEGNRELSRRNEDYINQAGLKRHMLGKLIYSDPHKEFTGVRPEFEYAEPLENLLNNTLAGVNAAFLNMARSRIMRDQIVVNKAHKASPEELAAQKAGMLKWPTVKIKENGVEVEYVVDDHEMFTTLEGETGLSFVDQLNKNKYVAWATTGSSQMLREMITRNPGFVLPNLLRDAMVVWAVSGGDPLIVAKAFKRAAENIAADWQEKPGHTSHIAVKQGGVSTGFDEVQHSGGSQRKKGTATMRRMIETGSPKRTGALVSLWDWTGRVSQISESATRDLVYEAVYKASIERLEKDNTYSEADRVVLARGEALFQAKEILNFNRRGNSQAIKTLIALAPFLNARAQGMDILWRAVTGIRDVGIDRFKSHDEIQSGIMRRGMAMATVSMVLALMNMDDEEYENEPGYKRDDNWFIKMPWDGYFTLPSPFEPGFLFKTIPEQITRSAVLAMRGEGEQAKRDALRAMIQFMSGTFGPTQAIPVVLRPFLNIVYNKDLQTRAPINPRDVQDLPAWEQEGPKTNIIGSAIGEITGRVGISPNDIDNLVRTLAGGLGVHIYSALNIILRSPAGIVPEWPMALAPPTLIKDVPVARRLFTSGTNLGGAQTAYYEYRNELEQAYQIVHSARNTPQERARLRNEYRNELVARKRLAPVNKEINRLRKMEKEVLYNHIGRSRTEIGEALDRIRKMRKRALRRFTVERGLYDKRS